MFTRFRRLLGSFIAAMLLLASVQAKAGAYTSWGIPEYVERVANGILIKGPFGDPNSCGETDFIYYPATNPDYDVIVGMALTALTAGNEMKFYASGCTTVSWHWGTNPVINESVSVVYIR